MAGSRLFTVNDGSGLPRLIAEATANWDAWSYLEIAEAGYTREDLIAFFPGFPAAVAAASVLLRPALPAALALNFVCHLIGAWYLYRLVLLDQAEEVARRALLCYLVFPTSFTAVIPYSESLYFASAVGALLYFRRGRYLAAALLALLSTCTRITAVAIVFAFVCEGMAKRRDGFPWRRALVCFVLPWLGLVAYLYLNYRRFGDPFRFLAVQKAVFNKEAAWPHVGFMGTWYRLAWPPPANVTLGACELFGGLLAWVVTAYSFVKLRKSDAAFSLVATAIFTCQAFWQSSLRYVYTVFPLYTTLGRITRAEPVRAAWLAASIGLLALLSLEFARGYWAAV